MRVDELKNKILQLAIQGKLIPQDENDIPASVLLEEIRKEKEQLIKEKKIKKEKPLPQITEEEKPFELPKGWEWVRLGEIGITQTGTTPPTSNSEYFNGEIPFIKPADISSKGINFDNESLTLLGLEKGRKIEENSVLMVCIGGSIGKSYYTDRLCSCNQQINSITPLMNVNNKLIYYFISTQYFYNKVIETATGTATPIIKKSNWEKIIIPLPSVEEQLRIVQKVDELFAIIDELAENKEAMLKNISDTRNKVLQLAIQGKLVEQNPEDIPASVLLEEIRKEKEQLIKEKKIKKEKPLSKITEEEKQFELPKGWEWSRLGNIITLISGRDLSSNLCNSDRIGTPYVMGASNMTDKGLVIERWIENPTVIGLKEDIMISVKGTVGKIRIIDFDEVHLSRQVMSIRCLNDSISNKYISIYLNSYIEKIKEKSSGVIPGISREDILQIPIALPSVEEQLRIVQKVDKIMAYLDELEKTII